MLVNMSLFKLIDNRKPKYCLCTILKTQRYMIMKILWKIIKWILIAAVVVTLVVTAGALLIVIPFGLAIAGAIFGGAEDGMREGLRHHGRRY